MDLYNLLQDLRIDSIDAMRRFGNQQSILERFLLKFLDDSTMLALKDAFSCHEFGASGTRLSQRLSRN